MGDGYQREAKHKENRVLQTSTLPTVSGEKKPQDSRTSLDQTSFKKTYVYEIGPPSWIEKQINANTLKHRLVLLLGCWNVARSHSRPRAMVADHGRYMVVHARIEGTCLHRVGGGSAWRIISRKVTSAPLMSSKARRGMSISPV